MKSIIQKHNKGFVLAICFVSLLLISLLAASILLSVSVQQSAVNLQKAAEDSHIELSQIGENFIKGEIQDGDTVGNYSCYVSGMTLTVKNKDGKGMLTVEKDGDGNILSWHTSYLEGEAP